MTIETFKREIAAAVKAYDKFVVCLEKTPEDFEASLVSLMAKAIKAYENRGAGLRHGIALDNQVTIILSQGDDDAAVVRHLFQSPFALPEERAPQDGESVHRKITQEGRLNFSEGRVTRAHNSTKPEWGLAELAPPVKSLVAHFVAHLGFAGDQVGHDVVVTLRAGDFDFADFHAVAIQKKALLQLGHLADGKTQHDKTSGGIVGNDPGGERIVRRDNRLRGFARRAWRVLAVPRR